MIGGLLGCYLGGRIGLKEATKHSKDYDRIVDGPDGWAKGAVYGTLGGAVIGFCIIDYLLKKEELKKEFAEKLENIDTRKEPSRKELSKNV